jgi:hypothetical protein
MIDGIRIVEGAADWIEEQANSEEFGRYELFSLTPSGRELVKTTDGKTDYQRKYTEYVAVFKRKDRDD